MIHSQRDLILAVAATLPEEFTKPDLVVACWRAYPSKFGMRAYDLPDAQRVYPRLDGVSGLVDRGWIRRTIHGTHRVSASGHARLRTLADIACDWCGGLATLRDADGDPICTSCMRLSAKPSKASAA